MSLKLDFKELNIYRCVAFLVFVFCMMASFSFLAVRGMQKSSAASLANFKPGNIINDSTMSNYNSMSKDDIQRFLTSKNPCNDRDYNKYLRLKAAYPNNSWHFDNGHFICLSEERFGDGETIGSGQTAAEIIYQAAQDYKINPQVLLVLLQKEQGLITDTYPNKVQYRAATGFGCPDTAACSTKYYGFKNQVRNAASMFREVLNGGWSNYPAYNTVYVQYNPNANCGGSHVYIENRATSALYRYTPYQPNSSALNAGYGTGDVCGAYGNRNFYLYFTDWFGNTQTIDQTIHEPAAKNDLYFECQTHVAQIGWQAVKTGGEASGTVGQSLRLEAFSVGSGQNNSKIVYRSHVERVGWESTWHHASEISGTTGESRAIEAVQFQLTDDLAKQYDIYYRVHASNIGWMGWAKNGAPAGSTGETRPLEAIQIAIIKKGSVANLPPSATNITFSSTDQNVPRYVTINYQAHTANIGWMNWVGNGGLAGTTGQGRQMEAINLKLSGDDSNSDYVASNIQYRAYANGRGWMNWVKDGASAGTTGESRPLEAIEIKLSNNLADRYSIRYRAHVSDIGWMNWVKDGESAGVINQGHRIEAIEIQLVRK